MNFDNMGQIMLNFVLN